MLEKTGISDLNDVSYKWVFLNLKKPICGAYFWNLASRMTIFTVGVCSKFVIYVLNTTNCYNKEKFDFPVLRRPESVPLITVSNHQSVFDDPGIWGTMDYKLLFNRQKMRWAMAAHEVCFTNTLHAYFFMLGKAVPVIRGIGVFQEAVDFCLERLAEGDWVHVFPEGRINQSKDDIRFKWGVGRLIYESPVTPILVPIWHLGMDDVVPNSRPYICRTGKKVTINFGEPIDFSELVSKFKSENISAENARKIITEKIQQELMVLKKETEELHNK